MSKDVNRPNRDTQGLQYNGSCKMESSHSTRQAEGGSVSSRFEPDSELSPYYEGGENCMKFLHHAPTFFKNQATTRRYGHRRPGI